MHQKEDKLERPIDISIVPGLSVSLLRTYIEYKAREAGIPIILIDPRNTSKECKCYNINKSNRPERFCFRCVSCGFEGEADYIASLNIRNIAAVNQPIVTSAFFRSCYPPSRKLLPFRVK